MSGSITQPRPCKNTTALALILNRILASCEVHGGVVQHNMNISIDSDAASAARKLYNCNVDIIQHIDIYGKQHSYSDRRFEMTPVSISSSPKFVPAENLKKLPRLTVITKTSSYQPGQGLLAKRRTVPGKNVSSKLPRM
ncbi:uncharacterized protein LOC125239954 [Leguminivora glycinivorella]|uniref:uncharacterized protein LOC125239954 n=1 Tax=Leguminivora glycinivorella TaxID=1035111 RepID=UPI00200E2702|nr:uncharacterized protein LOC125239954 [Leguminivora glycinivorella]